MNNTKDKVNLKVLKPVGSGKGSLKTAPRLDKLKRKVICELWG